jgi:hypothetical protein
MAQVAYMQTNGFCDALYEEGTVVARHQPGWLFL